MLLDELVLEKLPEGGTEDVVCGPGGVVNGAEDVGGEVRAGDVVVEVGSPCVEPGADDPVTVADGGA